MEYWHVLTARLAFVIVFIVSHWLYSLFNEYRTTHCDSLVAETVLLRQLSPHPIVYF